MELSESKFQELKEKRTYFCQLQAFYFIDSENKVEIENILKLLNENICSFKEIVDKFKRIKERVDKFTQRGNEYTPNLFRLLANQRLFEELFKNGKISKDDLSHLLNRLTHYREMYELSMNNFLLCRIAESSSVFFKVLVDKYICIFDLYKFLENKKVFEELIQNNTITQDDLKYLLNKIEDQVELAYLCRNTPLIYYILNEFVLNKEDADKLNAIVESSWYKKDNGISTLFELIDHCNKDNEEILKLNALNKKLYLLNTFDLNEDQRDELIELIQSNAIARNKLIQIIDNNLESNYDFESLMQYLKKPEKKSILSI